MTLAIGAPPDPDPKSGLIDAQTLDPVIIAMLCTKVGLFRRYIEGSTGNLIGKQEDW